MLDQPHSEEAHIYEFTLPESRDEGGMWLHWLTRLRWAAIAGVVLTTSLSYQALPVKGFAFPVFFLSLLTLVAANGNAEGRLRRGEPISTASLLNHLSLDVLVLTALFMFAGGPSNPFVVLYLVHVVMGAVMLPAFVMVGFTLFVFALYVTLHAVHFDLLLDQHFIPAGRLMTLGQIVAMFVTIGGIATFTLGLANSLRRHQRRLLEHGLPQTETEEAERSSPSHQAHAH